MSPGDQSRQRGRSDMGVRTVSGFAVPSGFAYDLDNHMWVQLLDSGHARVGMDALGVETSGTLAQLSFAVGSEFKRGEPFGTLEAEKFVGPLFAPLSGRITAVNEAAMADPGLVERDPYGAGWFVEVLPTAPAELGDLIRDDAEVVDRFQAKVRQYRIEGVLAE